MTEKDAVKCRGFAEADWWFVELEVAIERAAAARLLTLVLERTGLTGAGVPLG
jgi:tetraacyldisaccharide 4'-kinase